VVSEDRQVQKEAEQLLPLRGHFAKPGVGHDRVQLRPRPIPILIQDPVDVYSVCRRKLRDGPRMSKAIGAHQPLNGNPSAHQPRGQATSASGASRRPIPKSRSSRHGAHIATQPPYHCRPLPLFGSIPAFGPTMSAPPLTRTTPSDA
jgi:hypothetical protein